MTTHELKTWPSAFRPLLSGRKLFELRKNDRDFQVGDRLFLREWDPDGRGYTGRMLRATVGYILHAGAFPGLEDGYVVLGLSSVFSGDPL